MYDVLPKMINFKSKIGHIKYQSFLIGDSYE